MKPKSDRIGWWIKGTHRKTRRRGQYMVEAPNSVKAEEMFSTLEIFDGIKFDWNTLQTEPHKMRKRRVK